jgi:mono/diheme cytochrome c family protein
MLKQARFKTTRAGLTVAAAAFAALVTSCAPDAADQPVDIAVIDSVLAELGGTATAAMERGTRWRMIASIGSGLPPTNYSPDELPQPGSRGAGLLQVYCIQCHWLPSPKMHTATEWEYLLRNMLLRAQTLEHRLGGPLTTGMVGDVVMAGLETAEYPTPEQTDSMLAYLQGNAMIEAEPGELTAGDGRDLFLQKCAICHAPPSPRAHTAAGWDAIVAKMRGLMNIMDLPPISDREADAIAGYLRDRAAR